MKLIPKISLFKSAQLLYRWQPYFDQIELNQIYYKSSHRSAVAARRMWPPSFYHKVLPFLWVFFWFLRSNLSILVQQRYHWLVDTPLKQLILLDGILPVELRTKFASSILFCSSIFFICIGYEAYCSLDRLTFLAIFVCRPRGPIKPRHLHLNTQDYACFHRFCVSVTRWYRVCILYLTFCGQCLVFIMSLVSNAFHLSWIVPIFYIVAVYFWVIYGSQVVYGTSVQCNLVTHYLVLKQRRLLAEINRGLKRKSPSSASTTRLLRRYVRLCGEIEDYDRFWSTQLTVLINANILLLTYLVYQVFLQALPLYYTLFMALGLVFQVGCVCFLLRCSNLAFYDRQICNQLRRTLHRSNHLARPPLANQLRLQNLGHERIGFATLDGRVIKTNAYMEILINTTLIIFLAFKKLF